MQAKTYPLRDLFFPSIPGPQLPYAPHPTHSLHRPHLLFPRLRQSQARTLGIRILGSIYPPPLDLFFPTFQYLNYHINLAPHTPCMDPAFHFRASGNPKHVGSISAFWGQNTHPRPIFSSRHLSTSTIVSTSPHALPAWAPHFVSVPQAIPSMYARYPHFGVNIPTPTRSFFPSISGPQLSY